ncbi:hypothetical protein SAMN05216566_10995 [Aureimonas phyllosphaerae]|nr:hypothetical protein SAMN05216566_10995 [Aureimonas phyllosphaerae]
MRQRRTKRAIRVGLRELQAGLAAKSDAFIAAKRRPDIGLCGSAKRRTRGVGDGREPAQSLPPGSAGFFCRRFLNIEERAVWIGLPSRS